MEITNNKLYRLYKYISYIYSHANIHCEVVKGYAKNIRYELGEDIRTDIINRWVVVRLDGRWYMCDVNFGSSSMSKNEKKWKLIHLFTKSGDNQSEKTTYGFKEAYFITNPEEFIYNHFPLDSKYQLLARNVTFQEYRDMAYLRSDFFRSNLRIISHPRCVINADHSKNEILIGTDKGQPVNFAYDLYLETKTVIDTNLLREIENGSFDVKRYIVMFQDIKNNLFIIRLRLPQTAHYKLSIYARRNNDKDPETLWCFDYRIIFKKDFNYFVPPFPKTFVEELGPTFKNLQLNFENMYPLLGMYNSPDNDFTEIQFQGDDQKYDFGAWIFSNKYSANFLQKFCLLTFENGVGLLRFYFPSPGEYAINILGGPRNKQPKCPIFFPFCCFSCFNSKEKSREERLIFLNSYVVTCTGQPRKTLTFPENGDYAIGKQEKFFNLKLKTETNAMSYNQTFKSFDFKLLKEKSLQFFIQLYWFDAEEKKHDLTKYCFYENHKKFCQFFLNFPLPGMYKFDISSKEFNSRKSYESVYTSYFNISEIDNDVFEFPTMFDKWKISETNRVLQPFKKLYTGQNIQFQIDGLKADEVYAERSTDRQTFPLINTKGTWSGEINSGDKGGELTIKAKLFKDTKIQTNLLQYNIYQKPIADHFMLKTEEELRAEADEKLLQNSPKQDEEMNEESQRLNEIDDKKSDKEEEKTDNENNDNKEMINKVDELKNNENLPGNQNVIIVKPEIETNKKEIENVEWKLEINDIFYVSEFVEQNENPENEYELVEDNKEKEEEEEEEGGEGEEEEKKTVFLFSKNIKIFYYKYLFKY